MARQSFLIVGILLFGVAVSDCRGASLGVSSIFEKFLNVTDLLGGMPPILEKIAADIVDDIRDLIPHLENLLSKNNITEKVFSELGKILNITRITHELIPELDDLLQSQNFTEKLDEISALIEVRNINEKLMPEVQEFLESNNATAVVSEIKDFLNVSRIADDLLPHFQEFVESNNLTKRIDEIRKFLNVSAIDGQLIRTLEKILENDDVVEAIGEAKNIFNITYICDELLPELEKVINSSDIHTIIAEVRKFTNVTGTVGELLDELQKHLDESNITRDAPDLAPFFNVSIIREKLPEIQRIIDHGNITDILDEIERLLNVSYLCEKLWELEVFLERVGVTQFLSDVKALLEIDSAADQITELEEMLDSVGLNSTMSDLAKLLQFGVIKDKISAIEEFLASSNWTDSIPDIAVLLNASYIRAKIVPEIERILERINLTAMIEQVEKLANATYLRAKVVPEIERFLLDHNITDQLKAFLELLNTTYLKDLLNEMDEQLNITAKGKRISEGKLSEVVNDILDQIFEKDENAVEEEPTTHSSTVLTTSTPQVTTNTPQVTTSTSQVTTNPTNPTAAQTTLPSVCSIDCQDVPCGTAIMNSCGVCVEGTTGLYANQSKDCNNVCNGIARIDICGTCTNPPVNDPTSNDSPFTDCNGACFGSAAIDSCGNCSGGETGKVADFWKDACDLCGGDNSSCTGCSGVPNSGMVNDSCGVCGGDGSSCTTISMVVPSLLPTTSSTSRTVGVYGAGLNGEAIKCFFDGVESAGTVGNLTHCQCSIPSGDAGAKDFTVKVIKNTIVTTTSDLKITLYDATAVKITAVQPSEMFTKETTAVTFVGSGFDGLDSSAAVCITNTTKVKAVLANSSYTCTLPEFAKSVEITLDLSLNGVDKLASDVSLTRIVYAKAPSLTNANFSNTGARIDVVFDKDVDTTLLTSCSDVFADVSLLGTSPDCSWSDGRHLTITPRAGAQILPDATLTLKTNAVKSGGEQYSKYAAGSVTVGAPTNPEEPVSVIVGPTQISSCGHLSLDGSQSSGGGGRDLNYTWSLVGTPNAGITAVLVQAKDNAKVFLNGTLMTSGVSYTIKLAVQNFLGSSWKENTIVVTKASDPLPEVTVDGPFQGKILAANSFYITAMAKAASCSSSKALAFTWTVLCTSNDGQSGAAKTRAEISSGFQRTSSKSALKIDAGSLVGGKTYEFTVVVALKASLSTATTMKTTVVVNWSPLEPAILGGDRTLGRDTGSLILDAKSSTLDPDNADGDLTCSWICKDLSNNKQPCYSAVNQQNKIALPNECVVNVPSVEFAADKSYEITTQVSKGSRTGSSSIVVTVVAGNPPAVRVLTPSIKVVASEKVELQGMFTSSTNPTKMEWICAQDEDYRYIDLSDTSLLSSTSYQYNPSAESFAVVILKENVLTPGATYKFILNVDDGSKVGSSNMVVEVRSGPTSGNFEASPTTLELLDMVTLTASLWVTDSDAYPLEYEFGFVDGSGIFQTWVTQTSSEYKIPVPPGAGQANKLTLAVKVKDAFGSMKWMEKNITVNPATSIDEGQVAALVESSLQEAKDTGDYSKAVPNMMNILRAVSQNANVSENFAKQVTNSTVSTLLLAVDSTSLDEEKAAPILKTFIEVDADYVEQVKEVLAGFQEVVKAAEKNLDKETVEKTLKWIGDISSKADLNDTDVLKNLASVDDSLASSLAGDVGFGQPAIETSADNPRAVIKVAHSSLVGSVQAKTSEDATEVDFGNELSDKYGVWDCDQGKMCLGVKIKMISYKKDYYSGVSSTKPSILSDKIISISLQNPETGEDLSVSGLSDPIKLTFNTGPPSAGKTLVCYYYNENEQKWSGDGMTWSMVSGVFKVSASHFTSFSPAEEDDTSSQAPITDKVYRVSFVLSNTSWNESYSDLNDPDSIALKNKILQEFNNIYKNDPTMKSSRIEKFEKSGGNNVMVVIETTFSGTNTNPSEKLKLSLADGMLGDLAVDANSLDWVEAYDQSNSDDEDNTSRIIGIVVGVCVAVCIIAALIVFLVYYNQKQRKTKVHSRPVTKVSEYDNSGMDDHEMLPV